MKSLKEQMQSYGAYHKDPRNKLTHFLGVPLVTFALAPFERHSQMVRFDQGGVGDPISHRDLRN